MQQLSRELETNLKTLDGMFGTSADYYAKKITIYHCKGCIVLFDGMASLDSLWALVLDGASRQAPPQSGANAQLTGEQVYALILQDSAFPAESSPVEGLPARPMMMIRKTGEIDLPEAIYTPLAMD